MKADRFKTFRSIGLSSLLVLLSVPLFGQPPTQYSLNYKGSMGSLHAESKRSLEYNADTQSYHLHAESKLKLLGKSITTIREDSLVNWNNDEPYPLEYHFKQSGLGSRERSIVFDSSAAKARYAVDEKMGELDLATKVYDDLSAYLAIRQQLLLNKTEIRFAVLDKDNIKSYHYRVLDEENLETDLGVFTAVHVERVRDEDSARTTEFWLSPEHDYLLLRLFQVEPSGREINLEITSGTVEGLAL